MQENLPQDFRIATIRFLNKRLDENEIMDRLLPQRETFKNESPVFVHFDITPSVTNCHYVFYVVFYRRVFEVLRQVSY